MIVSFVIAALLGVLAAASAETCPEGTFCGNAMETEANATLTLLQVGISVHGQRKNDRLALSYKPNPVPTTVEETILLSHMDQRSGSVAEGTVVLLSHEQELASVLTNGGTSTLQGLPTGGDPLKCSVPMCSRSDSCQGAQCCSTQMFEALSVITDWMDSSSIEYVVLFGTLLGAHRDKDMIPWTGDVDLGIYAKDVGKLIAQNGSIPWHFAYTPSFGIPRGCEDHHPGFPGNYSNFTMHDYGYCNEDDKFCSYYVDFYVMDDPAHGGSIAEQCIKDSLEGDGHVNKTTVRVRGKKFAAPSAVESCLVAEYGSNWTIPDDGKSYHGF